MNGKTLSVKVENNPEQTDRRVKTEKFSTYTQLTSLHPIDIDRPIRTVIFSKPYGNNPGPHALFCAFNAERYYFHVFYTFADLLGKWPQSLDHQFGTSVFRFYPIEIASK